MDYGRDLNPIMRPELDMFYVLDTSGSMNFKDRKPITTLNRAMRSTIQAVRIEAEHNRDAEVKIAVLEFNSTCRWINPAGPERLDAFMYEDLAAAGGTNVGIALRELNSKLSKREFINGTAGNLMPVIIFMTDGFATDEYQSELDKIKQNKWFSHATRIGFAIGDDPDEQMIANLTGSYESVIRTRDLDLFARLLTWVSMTSSMLNSSLATNPGGGFGPQGQNMGEIAVSEVLKSHGINSNTVRPDIKTSDGSVFGPEPFGKWGPVDEDFGDVQF